MHCIPADSGHTARLWQVLNWKCGGGREATAFHTKPLESVGFGRFPGAPVAVFVVLLSVALGAGSCLLSESGVLQVQTAPASVEIPACNILSQTPQVLMCFQRGQAPASQLVVGATSPLSSLVPCFAALLPM